MDKGLIKYSIKQKKKTTRVVRTVTHKQYVNGIDTFKKLEKNDKNRLWYIDEIKNVLEIKELPICIIDDIFSLAEFDEVLSALSSLKTYLTGVDKKDSKNGHREKEYFYNAKKKFIEVLKKDNQYKQIEELEKIEFIGKIYYEDELYNNKQILYASLINTCNCGQYRAKNIIKILEEI